MPVGSEWQRVVQHYSGGGYGVDRINSKASKQGDGAVAGDRKTVAEAAARYKIPFELLWGTYGVESGYGTGKWHGGITPYFGLTYKYPGRGTSGNFRKDAFESAKTWADLFKHYKGKSPSYGSSTGSVPAKPKPILSGGGAQPFAYRPRLSGSMLRNEPYLRLVQAQASPPSSKPAVAKTVASPMRSGTFNYQAGTPRLSHPSIRKIVAEIAGVYGKPLTIGTTTNHSRLTVNGNVSDHYSGNAADIPATGEALTRMGQSALVALGWSPERARTAKGGVYNIRRNGKRYQVLFNTTTGGNHWNHLHVGVK